MNKSLIRNRKNISLHREKGDKKVVPEKETTFSIKAEEDAGAAGMVGVGDGGTTAIGLGEGQSLIPNAIWRKKAKSRKQATEEIEDFEEEGEVLDLLIGLEKVTFDYTPGPGRDPEVLEAYKIISTQLHNIRVGKNPVIKSIEYLEKIFPILEEENILKTANIVKRILGTLKDIASTHISGGGDYVQVSKSSANSKNKAFISTLANPEKVRVIEITKDLSVSGLLNTKLFENGAPELKYFDRDYFPIDLTIPIRSELIVQGNSAYYYSDQLGGWVRFDTEDTEGIDGVIFDKKLWSSTESITSLEDNNLMVDNFEPVDAEEAYFNDGVFDEDQELMLQITSEEGNDVSDYVTPDNAPEQIYELSISKSLGIPGSKLKILADPTVSFMAIQAINKAWKKKIDLTKYLPWADPFVLNQGFLGAQAGLDPDKFIKRNLDHRQIEQLRKELEAGGDPSSLKGNYNEMRAKRFPGHNISNMEKKIPKGRGTSTHNKRS